MLERETVYYRIADDFWTLFNESRSDGCRPVVQQRFLEMFNQTLEFMASRGVPQSSFL